MQHASKYKPRIFPINGDTVPSEIDRAQAIDPTISTNREKVEEIGRTLPVGWLKKSPTVGYRLTQLEYGSIEFYQKLINSDTLGNNSETEIDISDFKAPYFDICAYLTDDDGTYTGTLYYPALRTAGFSFSIGDPQARIERSFDFVGEQYKILKDNNQYLIYVRDEVETADLVTGDDIVIDLSARAPVEDPNTSGVYMFRVVRVRSGVSTELVITTDYAYNSSTEELRINVCQIGDIHKIWYSSATAPAVQFTENDADASAILGDSASIFLYVPATGGDLSSGYVYRLQSVTLDVRFDREDIKEVGNKEVVLRGIRNSTVTVTLGQILEDFTLEDAMQGSDIGIIDVENLSDTAVLIVKIYSDNTKTTFKYGFKATGLTATELRGGAGVNEYTRKDDTLEGESLIISADETNKIKWSL